MIFRRHTLELVYRVAVTRKKQKRRFTDTGSGGKSLPFRRAQIGNDESYSVLILRPERVDDTLQLQARRSAGIQHLNQCGIAADGVKASVG
jgi:hypothetical protein